MNTLHTNLYNKFYYDYVNDVEGTHPFISSLSKRKVTSINPEFESDPEHFRKIKAILAEQNKDQDSEKASLYLKSLTKPETLIVITGQQLGVFASPLYTIYKLITTIKLVEKLNSKAGNRKYVPVFWLETEDHDFQEINHTGIVNKNSQPEKLIYKGEDRGKVSIKHYQFDPSLNTLIDNLKNNLLETEFSAEVYDKLQQYYREGVSWAIAARAFLKDLFGEFGLLFFEPGDEKIKKISTPFFVKLLKENDQVSSLFAKTSEELIASGYHNQVKVIPGQTYIHVENEAQQRMHLYRQDDSFGFKDQSPALSLAEAVKMIESRPLAVSSTVISRPLLQSWLLPVAAYVAGPGEIAYWAQEGKLFDHFKLDMPVLYPRISATIVEPKINRFMSKYDVTAEMLFSHKTDFIDQYYKSSDEAKENPLEKLQRILLDEERNITAYLKSVDQTLVDGGKKTIERMGQTLTNFESRVLKAKKDKESLRTNHLEQIYAAFFPEDMPQERYLGIVYLLNKFGPDFLNYLSENLDPERFEHQMMYL